MRIGSSQMCSVTIVPPIIWITEQLLFEVFEQVYLFCRDSCCLNTEVKKKKSKKTTSILLFFTYVRRRVFSVLIFEKL